MKHHGTCKDASENCRMNFWLILNFCDFLPFFEFLYLLLGLPWQDIGSHDELSLIIPLLKSNSSFHWVATCQEWSKLTSSLLSWAKKEENWNFSQNSNLLFSSASLHVSGCFIPQTKSPTYVIQWLEGYSEIFTYVREISNQSCNANFDSPCSWKSWKNKRHI